MRRLALGVAFAALTGAVAAEELQPRFRWPLMGKAEAAKDGRGLDIAAPEGDPVHAGADGEVIYASDEIASFGRMVVLRHAGDYVTTYAHLRNLTVAKGARVKRGQIIGAAGKTGDAKASGVHFELRRGETQIDPVGYLTPR